MKRRDFLQNVGAVAIASALPIPAASKPSFSTGWVAVTSAVEARVLLSGTEWVRVARDVESGACAWYTSPDGETWQPSEPLPHILRLGWTEL